MMMYIFDASTAMWSCASTSVHMISQRSHHRTHDDYWLTAWVEKRHLCSICVCVCMLNQIWLVWFVVFICEKVLRWSCSCHLFICFKGWFVRKLKFFYFPRCIKSLDLHIKCNDWAAYRLGMFVFNKLHNSNAVTIFDVIWKIHPWLKACSHVKKHVAYICT